MMPLGENDISIGESSEDSLSMVFWVASGISGVSGMISSGFFSGGVDAAGGVSAGCSEEDGEISSSSSQRSDSGVSFR